MIPGSLTCFFALPALTLAARPKDAIKLSDVRSLTLRGNGAMTNHRRVGAIPQLRCVSKKALCELYNIDVMRCTNEGSGWGDEDIQWSCTASLPEELKLVTTDVICEGYNSPDDPYVLKGSCGVEYRVALTRKGERRYPNIANGGWFSDGRGGTDWGALLFTIIFVAILGWIIYSACYRAQEAGGNSNRPRRRRDGWSSGGWGPGWGPDDPHDPPPPYPGSKPSSQTDNTWRPGFWSGAAGGAAAGYWAGSRNQHQHHHNHHNDGYGSIGRGGFGWGGRSGSSGSNTSNRHESTGFGSTSRR
ncbi:Transmembrane protein 66 [Fusarium austroafricanum]|uniref:Store-operated calcium entry-associated regulatory factor n=1 Tax=Fusarium austroafricanum TaxID=2364996 RepID=A0A8H4P0H4_9HYPO|nr:Transmembrane protein 66 [Fusarium austroafricanum]